VNFLVTWVKQKMNLVLKLVKAFSHDSSQGNPAAVCFSNANLTDTECKNIARQIGFSEAVFVRIVDGIPLLRFFSPEQEMSMCGHGILAAVHLLLDNKPPLVRTKAGDVLIHYQAHGLIEMEITTLPRYYSDMPLKNRIAELLGTSPSAIVGDPIKLSVGTPKVLVELRVADDLWNLRPNFVDLANEIPQGIYPYVAIDERLYYARQFNPATGIKEDPVTGIAAATLGVYLNNKNASITSFKVEQGHILDKKGTIFVDVSNGIRIGGYAIVYDEIMLSI
jgi:PhzF family phenazine biosynthesis protein